MGFFDFFKRSRFHGSNGFDGANGANRENGPDIPHKVFVETEGAPEDPKVITADDGSPDDNLLMLQRFLDKNYETQGYDDALRNPDAIHLEQNVDALRNQLQRTIKRVKTFYEDFIQEIDFHIDSRSRRGMIDTVEELKMKRSIAKSHVDKVLVIEVDAINKRGDSEGVVISYTRGFNNGLAAISHHNIMRKKF